MRKVEVGEKGFTLIETIVAAALLSLVFTTISLYYTSLVRLWDKGNDQTEVQQQVRVALGELVPDLQQTQSLNYHTFTSDTLNLGDGGELRLNIPQLTEGNPVLPVRYYLRGDSLIRDTGGRNPIAMHITRVKLKYRAGSEGLVEIEVEAAKGGTAAKMVTSGYLRNLRGGG